MRQKDARCAMDVIVISVVLLNDQNGVDAPHLASRNFFSTDGLLPLSVLFPKHQR